MGYDEENPRTLHVETFVSCELKLWKNPAQTFLHAILEIVFLLKLCFNRLRKIYLKQVCLISGFLIVFGLLSEILLEKSTKDYFIKELKWGVYWTWLGILR